MKLPSPCFYTNIGRELTPEEHHRSSALEFLQNINVIPLTF